MSPKACSHKWVIHDPIYGFLMTEKCFHCEIISTYFSEDQKPPLEEYRDGEHYWNFMESAQTVRFGLKCAACGKVVELKEMLGLMLCTGCDERCDVEKLHKKLEAERTWVYVAFSFFPVGKHRQLSDGQITALEDYFNQRRKSKTSRIKIVSGKMVLSLKHCYGEIIRDLDMLSLQQPASKTLNEEVR